MIAMRSILIALSLCFATSAFAAVRHRRPQSYCVPVYIEGAGTVLICAPRRRR